MAVRAKNQSTAETAAPERQLGLSLFDRSAALPAELSRAAPVSELVPVGPAALAVPEPTAIEEAPRTPRIFVVSELVRAARLTLESRFADVRVEGEVSGFKRSGPGHLYFCLKDRDAAIDCVMYSREASRLRFEVKDGLAVRLPRAPDHLRGARPLSDDGQRAGADGRRRTGPGVRAIEAEAAGRGPVRR